MRTLGLLVCAIVISTLFTAMAQEGIWEDSLPLDSVNTVDTGPVPDCTGTTALQDADGTCITALTDGAASDADALHTHALKATAADYLPLAGGTMTGNLIIKDQPSGGGNLTVGYVGSGGITDGVSSLAYLTVWSQLVLGWRPTIPADATPDIQHLGPYVLANFSGTISGFDYSGAPPPDGTFVIVETGGGFFATYDCKAGGFSQLVCNNDFDTIPGDTTAWIYGGSSVGWNLVWSSTLGRRRECQQTFTTEQAGDILMCGKALTEIHVQNITCVALGAVPVAQNVEIVDCDANAANCVDTNFEITADLIETNYVDSAGTSFTFDIDSWWGIKLNAVTTKAGFLNCQVEYLQF